MYDRILDLLTEGSRKKVRTVGTIRPGERTAVVKHVDGKPIRIAQRMVKHHMRNLADIKKRQKGPQDRDDRPDISQRTEDERVTDRL